MCRRRGGRGRLASKPLEFNRPLRLRTIGPHAHQLRPVARTPICERPRQVMRTVVNEIRGRPAQIVQSESEKSSTEIDRCHADFPKSRSQIQRPGPPAAGAEHRGMGRRRGRGERGARGRSRTRRGSRSRSRRRPRRGGGSKRRARRVGRTRRIRRGWGGQRREGRAWGVRRPWSVSRERAGASQRRSERERRGCEANGQERAEHIEPSCDHEVKGLATALLPT